VGSEEEVQVSDAEGLNAQGEPVILIERRGRVMVATLNRPEVRNAVNRAMWIGLGRALEECERDSDVWAFVLTGSGDASFCAGADLKALSRGEPILPDDPAEVAWGFAGYVRHVISKPTIAAVNGTALGGGTELCLASDLAIAADSAVFGLPEVKRGIFAGAGGVFRLPRQLPQKVAMEMIMTGEPISATRAQEVGLINAVVAQSDVLNAAVALAEQICANAPLAVQASKRIALGLVDGHVPHEDVLWELSSAEGEVLMKSEDAKEGPRAFAEKRAPQWRAR
jgi:crotonobetainyl-CoA hydratase